MKDLKIRVNNEAESKEAKSLLESLGFDIDFSEKGFKYLYLFAHVNEMHVTGDNREGHFKNKNNKKITLPELRDLVVLKRNDVGDANAFRHDNDVKYYITSDNKYYYFLDIPIFQWTESCNDIDYLEKYVKPIEKQMKEYLRKNSNGTYSYIGTVRPEHVSDFMIEIPEGGNFAVYSISGCLAFHKDRTSGEFFNVDSGCWRENGRTLEGRDIVWQRHTHPEELPFIDDEPKEYLREDANGSYILELTCKQEATEPHAKHWIEVPVGVNFYYSFASGDKVFTKEHSSLGRLLWQRKPPFSINDQYAEIEKVRQSHRTASEIADSALKHIRERAETYDQPTGERSAAKTAKAFNAITGKDITESEVWLLLQLLKDVRQWSRKDYHQDSAEDCIAYAALKAESLEGGE